MSEKKVWLVTGASKGLGLSLVKKLLWDGFSVAATSRKVEELKEAVGNDNENFLPLAVDLVSEQSVGNAVDEIINRFGRLDVVVNNAGYGQVGALEELTDTDVRANFDVNVFGSLNVIRKVMPQLRRQGSGHIFNIASIGGYTGDFPGWGIYCATKFAVVGFTEALAEEVKEFGIRATAVLPGYFRTNFLDAGSMGRPRQSLSEYTAVRKLEAAHINRINGNQAGDPGKAATAMIKAAASENAPVHLFLGGDAYEAAVKKMANMKDELESWKAVSTATNF